MNTLSVEHVRNVDEEASEVNADCLRLSLVLRTIFKHMDNKELVTLSRVNKLWNYDARSVMRERGTLLAHLKPDDGEWLEAFESVVQQMNVVPFAGVHFALRGGWQTHGLCQQPCSSAFPDQPLILDRLSWKHFSCQLNGLWVKDMSQWVLLMKKILQDFSGSLEQMSMTIYYKRNEVIEQVLRECSYPRLKILKLFFNNIDTDDSDFHVSLLKTLVSQAPNLKELHCYGSLSSLARVLEGSTALLMYPFWRFGVQVPDGVIDALRLERMILDYTGEDFNVQEFNRIVPQLLQISSNTLRSMQVDAVLAVPLMCYGICLRNVTELSIMLDIQQLQQVQPHVLRLVKNFDFTRLFPSLNKVAVECLKGQYGLPVDDINALIEPANLVLKEPLLDRAGRIKHLCAPLQDSMVGFFAEMFPDIEKLSVKEHRLNVTDFLDIPFGLIWTHWTDLIELNVWFRHGGLRGPRRMENLDSVFCGIFPEEVAELREKDEEYLKRVNIVPAMPSITLLKNLRTINVYCGEVVYLEPSFDDPTFVFSKVAKFLAFERCSQLVSCALHMKSCGFQVGLVDPDVRVVYSSP